MWVHVCNAMCMHVYVRRTLFGNCFYQNGGFHTFIWHVHDKLQPELMTHD